MVSHRVTWKAIGQHAAVVCTILSAIACNGTTEPELGEAQSAVCDDSDVLYVGDSDTIKRFNSQTGEFIDTFVLPTDGIPSIIWGLAFPRAHHGDLLVVNFPPGQLLRFDDDGSPKGALVPPNDKTFSPRGVVTWKGAIFVADQGNGTAPTDGHIDIYNEKTGQFLRRLDVPSVLNGKNVFNTLRPRDLVIGRDKKLYVNVVPPGSTPGGYILRFNPEPTCYLNPSKTCFLNVVYDASPPTDPTKNNILNRPTGIVFGRDKRLYAMSNAVAGDPVTGDKSRIVMFNVKNGVATFADKIDLDPNLDTPGSELVFGPNDALYVTFNGSRQLRRYDVKTKTYVQLQAPGMLSSPGYPLFRGTDPATRNYLPEDDDCQGNDDDDDCQGNDDDD